MIDSVSPGPHGPLANVLAVRGGKTAGQAAGLDHREALIYTLGKAAELEHLIMLQYLFAAFSLKQNVSEGLSTETLAAVQRWRKTLLTIAEQEMLHLALVQNLLTAVGAAPRLARPNFPMPAYGYPAGVRIELLPFGEPALRHFAYLERPDGMDIEDAEGFEAIAQAVALPHDEQDEIVPHLQEFDTIGQLYRSTQAGLEHLADRLGPERLFIGPTSPRFGAAWRASRAGCQRLSAGSANPRPGSTSSTITGSSFLRRASSAMPCGVTARSTRPRPSTATRSTAGSTAGIEGQLPISSSRSRSWPSPGDTPFERHGCLGRPRSCARSHRPR
jgi:hypothetical protein